MSAHTSDVGRIMARQPTKASRGATTSPTRASKPTTTAPKAPSPKPAAKPATKSKTVAAAKRGPLETPPKKSTPAPPPRRAAQSEAVRAPKVTSRMSTNTQPQTGSLRVGDVVEFGGYEDPSQAGDLQPGQRVRVEGWPNAAGQISERPPADGGDAHGIAVVALGDDGRPRNGSEAEVVFPQELQTAAAKPFPLPKFLQKGKAGQGAPAQPVKVVDVSPEGEILHSPEAFERSPTAIGPMPVGMTALSPEQRDRMSDQDILDAAKQLSRNIERHYFELGGLLARIYETALFRHAGDYEGKRGFENYVKHELEEVDYRKAMYSISIYRAFSAVGRDHTALVGIGWSKAKEIARVAALKDERGLPVGEGILRRDIDDLLEKARSMKRDQLADYVTAQYMRAALPAPAKEPAHVVRQAFRFRLPSSKAAVVSNAIAAAKAAARVEDESEALEQICAEWALQRQDVELPVEEAIAALERRYGIRVTVAQ